MNGLGSGGDSFGEEFGYKQYHRRQRLSALLGSLSDCGPVDQIDIYFSGM